MIRAGYLAQSEIAWLKDRNFQTELELGRCLCLPQEGPCECDLYLSFLFQPAEEQISGAKPMVEQNTMQGVDGVIGLHLWSVMPVSTVAVRPGPVFARGSAFILTVKGKGGHAALPHGTVDPIVLVGAQNEEVGAAYPHHHPRFNIDEDALPIAVEVLSRAALEFLE